MSLHSHCVRVPVQLQQTVSGQNMRAMNRNVILQRQGADGLAIGEDISVAMCVDHSQNSPRVSQRYTASLLGSVSPAN